MYRSTLTLLTAMAMTASFGLQANPHAGQTTRQHNPMTVIVTGDDQTVASERTQNLRPFSQLQLNSSVPVTLVTHPSITQSRMIISGSDAFVQSVVAEHRRDVLRLSQQGTNLNHGRAQIRIEAPGLASIVVNGSGNLRASEFHGEHLQLVINGSGNIIIDGQVETLDASISGNGQLNASGLSARVVDVAVSGSGGAYLRAAEVLRAAVSGSGSVRYSGNPEQVNSAISGSGSVQSH